MERTGGQYLREGKSLPLVLTGRSTSSPLHLPSFATMDTSKPLIDGAPQMSCCQSGENFAELKRLLAFVSVELETTRETAKVNEKLQQARVIRLEELLETACRERDEFREKCMQLEERSLSSQNINVGSSGISSESLLRTASGMLPLETVSSMREPSRATLSEVHRKLQSQQQQYVSSMPEPTKDTLTEVHRKMHEQQQLEFQKLEMQQHIHKHVDLQQHHGNHAKHDLRQSSNPSHLDFQSQHQLADLRQHLELHPKDHLRDQQLHLDLVMIGRQAGEEAQVDNCDSKNTSWNEFSSGGILDISPSDEQCIILDSPEHMHISQGMSTPHGSQLSPEHLDGLQQLQQQHSSWSSSMGLSLPDLSGGVQNGLAEHQFQPSSLQGGSALADLMSPLVHLPEPPESDPQVVLNSLPERGKLFQAVVDAGPLLSTIMVTGRIPKWIHPPPPLDPEEIPLVSMGSAVVCHQ